MTFHQLFRLVQQAFIWVLFLTGLLVMGVGLYQSLSFVLGVFQ